MKYAYVFEDKANDNLQELRKLGEQYFKLYLKNSATISDSERKKNEQTIKSLLQKMYKIMSSFGMKQSDMDKAIADTIKKVMKNYGISLMKFGGVDILRMDIDLDLDTIDKSWDKAYKDFGTKLAEYVMLYYI